MKYKIEANHVLGVLTALFTASLVHMEASCLAMYLGTWKNVVSETCANNFIIVGNILAAILFLAVLFVFFKYVKNSLGSYLILSVVVSIISIFVCLLITGRLMDNETVRSYLQSVSDSNHLNIFISLVGVLYGGFLIFIFVVTFELMVKRKVNYLKHITAQVKKMEASGFGGKLQVKGNDELSLLSSGISRMSVTLKEKQELEKQEEEKRLRLIADISHDIRTPLTSVIGYAELVRENDFAEPEKCREYMEVIDRRLSDMKNMLDQLFDYTKFSQSDIVLEKQRVDLVPLFQYIDLEYGRIYKRNGLGWNMDINAPEINAEIDQEKFMRAMGNLLDNARKYSEKGTTIQMTLQQQEKEIVISLRNTVDNPDQLDEKKIFERFYKLDEARTHTDSTGLGLPIVKRIVELHGGQIEAQKEKDTITFFLHFPQSV